ncbi:MAG: 2-hydroxyacid dehydrogenase [Tepidiformaceae bacterium]
MARVFITRAVPGDSPALLAAAGHEARTWPGELAPPPEALREELQDAAAVMAMVTDRMDAATFAAAPGLRIVANMAVGHDNVDPGVAAEAGVWLTNTPGVLAETTADHAFALMLAAARHVGASDRDTRAGGWRTWSPTAFLGHDVHGATLGIVGLGEIGSAVARRARGFAMHVLYHNRRPDAAAERALGVEYASLEDLLAAADFVTIHAPLTAATRHLMGGPQFALMKPSAIFVNTARGGIVDQEALVEALREGGIAGAALDVTEPEPLPLGHPLFALPNVLITPHIASASFATRARMAEMAARNIIVALAGERPPNAVNSPTNPRP